MTENRPRSEVMRLLDRYLVEVVEAYHLCPWARTTREGGELAAEVVWGTPSIDAWVETAEQLLARPGVRVAMVLAPELETTASELHTIRNLVAERIPTAGIAEFHPDALLDLATPARLVPFVRRSPDPLLQLVPLSLLDAVRGPTPSGSRVEQVQMLGGHAPAPRVTAVDRIALVNHATVRDAQAEVVRILDDIADDRRRTYARVGISGYR